MNELTNFYLKQPEPVKSTFLALKDIIMQQDEQVTAAWKYGMPFFCFKGKMFCYLWFHKKYNKPYLGIVHGIYFNEPFLIQEKRSKMKIMLINAEDDLPILAIENILQKAVGLYKLGIIQT